MDRINAMNAFVHVVNEQSFTRAAERLGISPQLVSKYVGQLETHLGTRLLNRTTRRISLTETGTYYYQRAKQVLGDIDELENELNSLQKNATGKLRINAPVSFAIQHLAPMITDFQNTYKNIEIDLQLNDRKVDIIEEGYDIALRIGKLKDSSLIAKRIAPINLSICASPAYLAEHGTPSHPDELAQHQYLRYSYMDEEAVLQHISKKQIARVMLNCKFVANNGDVLVKAAINGAGIIIQPTFITGAAIASGELVPILKKYEPDPVALYAVYGHRQLLSNKVRCFLEFIDGYFGDIPYWDDFNQS